MFLGCLSTACVRSFRQMLLLRYLMYALSSFDKTDMEYLLAPADDLVRFWRSNVKVTAEAP